MKNIILITVDSLRYDHSKIIKDKMSEVLGQGIDFENAYSTGPGSLMSYIGLLSSKFPTFPDEKDSIHKPNIDRKRTLLYEVMKNNGFKTFVIANSGFHQYYGYDKGADTLIDQIKNSKRNMIKEVMSSESISMFIQKSIKAFYRVAGTVAKKEDNLPYFDAKKITEIVRDIIKNHDIGNRIFMHINYEDTHAPPNISNQYIRRNFSRDVILKTKFTGPGICKMRQVMDKAQENGKEYQAIKNDLAIYQKMYCFETLYAAEHINNLLNYFREIDMLEDALFILCSDHGEYLWSEGRLLGHGLPIKDKEDALNVFYDNLIHVPLMLWGVGKGKIDKMVSLVDLSPTILEMIGVEKPPEWYGGSLFLEKQKPVISEDVRHGYNCYCVRTNEWVFAYNEGTKQEYLFKRSPEEKRDVSSERPEVVKQMHEFLENHEIRKTECCREYLKKDIKIILKKGK